MVWYGMVWYGMVWYGMVWYGMVWYGMVACSNRLFVTRFSDFDALYLISNRECVQNTSSY